MSLVIDKQTRDLINELNKTKQDILKLKASINKILNTSTSIVATGSFGQEASNSHAALEGVQGNGPIHLSSDEMSHIDFFNSTFAEQFDFKITSNGTVITGSLEKTNTGDLTMQFDDGEYVILDCTPAKTVIITQGTDITPVLRYYYILQSAPTIITEALAWPSAEHIKVAKINVPSAAFIQTKNVYSNQNINNMNKFVAGDLSGMLVHLGHKIRESIGATYESGLAGAAGSGEYLDVSGGTTVRFKMDAGVIMQMHDHVFNAVDTSASSLVLVRNFSGTNWNDISNIYDIVNDSVGASIDNRHFNLVIIAIASKETDYIMINTPGGSYIGGVAGLALAKEDRDKFDDYTIPLSFKGVSTLVCRMTIRKAASAWVVHQIDDLRGITPASISGSTISGGYSDVDAIAAVEATGLVLDSTKVISSQDEDLTFLFGRTKIDSRASDISYISHRDNATATEFAVAQTAIGATFLNSKTGQVVNISVSGSSKFRVASAVITSLINHAFNAGINITGSLTMDGSGTDDEALQVPYLTAAPATLANGMIWMEADGLHAYHAGAEHILPSGIEGANKLQIGDVLMQWGDLADASGGEQSITFPVAVKLLLLHLLLLLFRSYLYSPLSCVYSY